MAVGLGWPNFYLACTLLAIPGLLLLPFIRHWFGESSASPSAPDAQRSALQSSES